MKWSFDVIHMVTGMMNNKFTLTKEILYFLFGCKVELQINSKKNPDWLAGIRISEMGI
ncbi:hypothetical protein GCM10011413_13810 [Pedobacter psychrotolerans]|uniref:Uncharacterized protein n=1 Tax=Pedobacter psychrotolerans TaxID=1843235 RepID=A0ABQ1SPR3_9SPHI|nr:hypothetical protein GCM10011413_13810 [Pedobacter psychrotolerans]